LAAFYIWIKKNHFIRRNRIDKRLLARFFIFSFHLATILLVHNEKLCDIYRGLDSSSCSQCMQLLRSLALQGRTIVATIHQPSATLFAMFHHVYVLAEGKCVYQGATEKLVPFLSSIELPCPEYNNPADYGKMSMYSVLQTNFM
jgi:hypothetical protein